MCSCVHLVMYVAVCEVIHVLMRVSGYVCDHMCDHVCVVTHVVMYVLICVLMCLWVHTCDLTHV